ncbi:hypothetical protein PWG14_23865 [Chromobacterium amazonense]|uniref:hypothetical protein n=1 Tax=Chromobacterium amazonense TaxID=1382803 RepID=UPI00237E77D5|nr:hypothetical protein [Chromobacterium amazonense]MDE1715504.1 hypothetical protein [Chromobacterium amazonense]
MLGVLEQPANAASAIADSARGLIVITVSFFFMRYEVPPAFYSRSYVLNMIQNEFCITEMLNRENCQTALCD